MADPTFTTLRDARDLILGNRPAQSAVRRGARAGLLPEWLYRRIQPLGKHPVTTPAGNTVAYVSNHKDQLARSIIWPGDWERTSLRVFSELAQNARVVVDGGAHTGIYSLVAAADTRAEIVAFEPNPEILPSLRCNVATNGYGNRIEVVEAALSATPGETRLALNPDISAVSINGEDGPTVNVTTLDLAIAHRPVDLIKLDIERHEIQALRGAKQLLTGKPDLILEILSQTVFEDIAAYLTDYGYRHIWWLGDKPRAATRKLHLPGQPGNYHFSA